MDEGQQVPPPAPLDDFVRGYNEAVEDVILLIKERQAGPPRVCPLLSLVDEIERWKSRDS